MNLTTLRRIASSLLVVLVVSIVTQAPTRDATAGAADSSAAPASGPFISRLMAQSAAATPYLATLGTWHVSEFSCNDLTICPPGHRHLIADPGPASKRGDYVVVSQDTKSGALRASLVYRNDDSGGSTTFRKIGRTETARLCTVDAGKTYVICEVVSKHRAASECGSANKDSCLHYLVVWPQTTPTGGRRIGLRFCAKLTVNTADCASNVHMGIGHAEPP